MTISTVIVQDEALRKKVQGVIQRDMNSYLNVFGFAAIEAATTGARIGWKRH